MDLTIEQLNEVAREHLSKAARSAYDVGVAISAIASARKVIEALAPELRGHELKASAVRELEALRENYNDPDGQFTNGKGVIGSLLDDVRLLPAELLSSDEP